MWECHIQLRVWAINDNYESIPGVLLQWKVTDCETDENIMQKQFQAGAACGQCGKYRITSVLPFR